MAYDNDSSSGSDVDVSDISKPATLPKPTLAHIESFSTASSILTSHSCAITPLPPHAAPNPGATISKHVLDLHAGTESRSGGLFKHFVVTSCQEHLAEIGCRDEQRKDEVELHKVDQALVEIE
jgi:hypothetical protein